MGKGQTMGPEGNRYFLISDAIFPVAHKRPAPAGKLHPDLMGATCFQTNADKGISFTPFYDPIA
jgi:hypothetical protein